MSTPASYHSKKNSSLGPADNESSESEKDLPFFRCMYGKFQNAVAKGMKWGISPAGGQTAASHL